MSGFDQDDDLRDDVPKFEDLKAMSKAEIQALGESSRRALESVVSMPDAVRSEKYNVIVSEQLETAENAVREAEKLLDGATPAPENDRAILSEAVAEASRLLASDILAQDEEGWRDTLVRLQQAGKEISASERLVEARRAEARKIQEAFRPAEDIDAGIRGRSEAAFHDMLLKAGVDWRLTASSRSQPPVDQALAREVDQAEEDFGTKTQMDTANMERFVSLKKASGTLKSRIRDMQQADGIVAAQEMLQKLDPLRATLEPKIKLRKPGDSVEADALMHGTGIFAKRAEEFGKEREALAVSRKGLESAFLGKLRHGSDIKSIDWKIAQLDAKISENAEVMERLANEEKRKERSASARAALRGVDLV